MIRGILTKSQDGRIQDEVIQGESLEVNMVRSRVFIEVVDGELVVRSRLGTRLSVSVNGNESRIRVVTQ